MLLAMRSKLSLSCAALVETKALFGLAHWTRLLSRLVAKATTQRRIFFAFTASQRARKRALWFGFCFAWIPAASQYAPVQLTIL